MLCGCHIVGLVWALFEALTGLGRATGKPGTVATCLGMASLIFYLARLKKRAAIEFEPLILLKI